MVFHHLNCFRSLGLLLGILAVVADAFLPLVRAQYDSGYGSGSGSGGGNYGYDYGDDYGSDGRISTSSVSGSSTLTSTSRTSGSTGSSNANTDGDVPYSAFSHGAKDKEIAVSVNVPSSANDDADFYFRMTAPDAYSWIAFGFGRSMSDSSLVFVAYRGQDGTGMTVSPRLATQHSQPKHDPVKDVRVTVLPGSGVSGGEMTVNAKCSNCRSWSGNSVNVKSTEQPMIVAGGTSSSARDRIKSDDLSENIAKHTTRGQYRMDLARATGKGGVPSGSTSGAYGSSGSSERHTARTAHAIMMLVAFVILYPLGVIFLRVLEKVRLHWLNQTFATLCIAAAAAIGIGISIKKKISPNLSSTHQIVGLSATGLVLIQMTLGFIHHRIFARTKRPTPIGAVHRVVGVLVIGLGIANGFLGFRFAGETRYELPYGIVVAVVLVILFVALIAKRLLSRRKRRGYTQASGTAGIPLMHRDQPNSTGEAGQSHVFARGGQQQYYDPPR